MKDRQHDLIQFNRNIGFDFDARLGKHVPIFKNSQWEIKDSQYKDMSNN